ncbi:MAG: hypothetical protein IM526_02990 [Microcystis sp. M38BS1]|uniref:hypothetical protein n=1 Tax=Microcystis sp. M38BS1 TaxID=2771188 RepID=UPI0031FC6BBA|nr:hypothetical protein [Microcystis sp. M38BS1]MCA6582629.1 hypothetical protein [Pseudanabaena sp. M34BS1SP1A06MG]
MSYFKEFIEKFLSQKYFPEYTQGGMFSCYENYLRAEFSIIAAFRDDLLIVNAERTVYNKDAFLYLPKPSKDVIYYNEHPYTTKPEILESKTCHDWYFLKVSPLTISFEAIQKQKEKFDS